MRKIIVIAHNLRSTHNVGSLLRTADGLGVNEVWLTGYTPYPITESDSRLPHLAKKIDSQINKTALGAEKAVAWHCASDVFSVLKSLRKNGLEIVALEQNDNSIKLPEFKPTGDVAIILGNEVTGIEPEVLTMCDKAVEIPMFGRKESYNVVQAAAMALYQCRFAI